MTLKLKILMCCHLPLKPHLGGAKVYLEAAEVYRKLGHEVLLVGIDDLVGENAPYMDEAWRVDYYPEILKDYILKNHAAFDVIEFESIYLPFDLKNKIQASLVARSVLLDLHLTQIKIPRFKGLRSLLGLLLKSRERNKKLTKKIRQSMETIHFADYVNVPNPSDQQILVQAGVSKDKIVIQPYGIFQNKYNAFKLKILDQGSQKITKKIAFVGTFDNRKGAVEFPMIVAELIRKNPGIEFKFLGVLGMFPSSDSIHKYLGVEFQKNITIIPHFLPDDLPELLKDCTVGVFPSYLESFGFGVLEMMAMGLPVVAYDSPGVNMLVPKELLVKAGDFKSIISLLFRLTEDENFLNKSIKDCNVRVEQYIYENQINRATEIYCLRKSSGKKA